MISLNLRASITASDNLFPQVMEYNYHMYPVWQLQFNLGICVSYDIALPYFCVYQLRHCTAVFLSVSVTTLHCRICVCISYDIAPT